MTDHFSAFSFIDRISVFQEFIPINDSVYFLNRDKFFADFDEESASDYEDRNVFKIIDYSKNKIGFADAISKLMNI